MSTKELTPKEKDIRKEVNRLKRILKGPSKRSKQQSDFQGLSKEKMQVADGLIQEVAFMKVTLQELKEDINMNGAIDEMPQGDYTILRESPSVKTYNTMIQRYTTASKELFNLLPKETPKPKVGDEFDEFVNNK